MNIMNLFRRPEPDPIVETPAKVETNRPKKTPIPGAPELPEGYYYSVEAKPPEEWNRDKYEFYLWVRIYKESKRGNSDERIEGEVDFQYTEKAKRSGYGFFGDADLTATAIKVYQLAFPAPIVLNIPESISDYIGDHRA
jgi:hypothetical protein